MHKLTLNIKGMENATCEGKIVDALKQLDGVMLVKVNYETELGDITFDETKVTANTIVEAITDLGYTVDTFAEPKRKRGVSRIVWGVAALLILGVLIYFLFLAPPEIRKQFLYVLL